MFKRVIVFGAHTFVGFALCERFVNEGVEVKGVLLKSSNLINKRLVDERLMMVGRNALFQTTETYERSDYENTVDMIIHCCDDGDETILIDQDRKLLLKSVEVSNELQVPHVFISTVNREDKVLRNKHLTFCEQYLSENKENRMSVHLPILFGPFQPPTEKIHQFLVNDNNENEILIIDEPILFIQDAVNAIFDLLSKFQHGKTYSIQSELKQNEKSPFSIKLKVNPEDFNDCRSEKYLIKKPTSIEKGLRAQKEFIEKYSEILKT
ncbi:NAD(P)-dependent oxidoreductase [Metabacillus bambusae]|uniref:NAD(P)-dependent oxidoreductase n=1 Tax=Metabacillus bambusae TaxID=2795218 RepID=A0ABS3N0I7_9BACI|nr:NAD(P)-dependent oxidoreductase [Metabacillus bambusae]MBO1511629.1 NAD(P)-dependent oxidoreductase [Metabacillus bambusae]